MGPLTERFEMRMDAETLARIDAWRSNQADVPGRADAIRRLIDAGLEQDSKEGATRLDRGQMLMTWLLTEILKNTPEYEDQKTISLIQDSLYGGHLWALDWQLSGLLHDQRDSQQALNFVLEVMSMWRHIERSWADLSTKDKDLVTKSLAYPALDGPHFEGFDGNEETEYWTIADFLVKKMERFDEFKSRSLNSHRKMTDKYKRMIPEHSRINTKSVGRSLSPNELILILNA